MIRQHRLATLVAAAALLSAAGCSSSHHDQATPTHSATIPASLTVSPTPSPSLTASPTPSNPYEGIPAGVTTVTPYVTPPVVASSGDVRVLKPTADGKIVHVPVDITNHGKDAADYRVTVRVYAGNDTSYFKTVTVDSGLLQPGGGTQSSYLVNDPYQIMVYDPQAKIVKVTRTPR